MNKERSNFSIVLIASTGALHRRTRLYKLGVLIGEMGGEIEHWSWCREGENDSSNHYLPVSRTVQLLRGGGNANKKLLLWYPLWVMQVFFYALVKGRDRQLYCLSFESAFPVAVVSLFTKRNFVFDHADNFSKTYPWPRILKKVFEKMEAFVVRQATIHIVPGQDRWQKSSDNKGNTRILRNTPSAEVLERAKALATEQAASRESRLVLYVNGWMGRTRGMKQVLEAVKSLGDHVSVIAAGRVTCIEAEELLALPNTTYYGQLPNEEALALYFQADLVFTYYDPSIEINRIAEPNKWGDCIMTGTPFLTNIEVRTAKSFLEKGACVAVPYANVGALREMLVTLARDANQLRLLRRNLAEFQDQVRPWDVEMRWILQEWLGNTARARTRSKLRGLSS